MPKIPAHRRAFVGRIPCVGVIMITILTLVLPTLAVPGLPAPVVQAATVPGAAVVVAHPSVAPAVDTDISPFRRKPLVGTSVTTPTLTFSLLTRTIALKTGSFTLPVLRQTLLDTYTGTDLYTQTLDLLRETAPGSKVWQLTANLDIRSEAALEISDATATWLRLVSSPTLAAPFIKNSGYVVARNTKITSWRTDTNAVDAITSDGRGYIVTQLGGRTDVYTSEIAYLGWTSGDQSGLAWRRRLNDADRTTGATGDVHDSNIHDNYVGIQNDGAFALWIARSHVTHNLDSGIDSNDQSNGMIIERNTITNNGRNGISLSHNCYANIVRGNTLTANATYGIVVERRSGSDALELNGAAVASGANQILDNTVSQHLDGIVVFQSSGNLIQGNTVANNGKGIRLNATPLAIPDATPDSLTRQTMVVSNTVRDNQDYGIMLYARADSNTIQNNIVSGNGRHTSALGSGIYVKTGGNTIGPNNTIFNNGHGLSIVALDAQGQQIGSSEAPSALAPSIVTVADAGLPAGSGNSVTSNHIYGNTSRGLRMSGADHNTIQNNEINANGDEGIYSDQGSFNLFTGNFVHLNGPPSGQVSEGAPDPGADGIVIKGVDAVSNRLSQNRISANGRDAIRIGSGANGGIDPPIISAIQTDSIGGTALPGALIEVFSDPLVGCGAAICGDEAATLIGTTTAAPDGTWQLSQTIAAGANYAATQTDANNNTSELSRTEVPPTVAIAAGRKGEPTLYVSGTNAHVNLSQVKERLIAYSQQTGRPADANLLTDDGMVDGKRTWTLRISLFISPTIALSVRGGAGVADAERVDWLRLFSNPDPNSNPNDPAPPIYDPTLFATIKAYNSTLLFQDTKVTSWDTVHNDVDKEKHDGRAFVLAKYDAEMNIIRSEMSYLGYADGESYGVSWRDVNSSTDPVDAPRRTRVTGQAIDSIFSHNYYGIYTFQARDMVFRNNKMFSNIQYGFDPHDFTHDVIVEGNEAYANGSHGFIISRGCSNFVFRNNISRDNKINPDSKNPSAHGFMLDPGADPLKAGVPQAPSVFNLFENNQAYGNDGYGLRIYGSNDNTIRNNTFANNRAGITLELGSTRNAIVGNTIKDSSGELVVGTTTQQATVKGGYGVYAFQGADGNTIDSNTISGNVNTGIYLKTAQNTVRNNSVNTNQGDGIGTLLETSSELPPDPPEPSSADEAARVPGAYIADQEPGRWSLAAATTPANNTIISNTVDLNLDSGIGLKNASGTIVEANTVTNSTADGIYISNASVDNHVRKNIVAQNGSYGIKVNGPDVQRNNLSQNSVIGNTSGGIALTGGANNGLSAPSMVVVTTDASQMPGVTAIVGSWMITGTATPGMVIELYSDAGQQAGAFEGSLLADAQGNFTFITNGPPKATSITATATDAQGNTSALSKPARRFIAPWVDSAYVVYLPVVRLKK